MISRNMLFSALGTIVWLSASAAPRATEFRLAGSTPAPCPDRCTLQMVSARTGWLFSHRMPRRTDDGGRSWAAHSMPELLLGDGAEAVLAGARLGWLLTVSQQLFRASGGGGGGWTREQIPRFDGVLQGAGLMPGLGIWLSGGEYQPGARPDAPNYPLKRYADGAWGILAPVLFRRVSGDEGWREYRLAACSWQVFELRFRNEREGLAIGDGCVYRTVNGGEDWTVATFYSAGGRGVRGYPGGAGHPTNCFLDGNSGWMSLDDGSLYRTVEASGEGFRQPVRSLSTP
jgi:hypothetical protein